VTASRARLVLLLVLALAPVAAPGIATGAPTQQEVEEALTCQCGCGLTVHSCNHLNCGSGEPMKAEIRERLGRGESKEQILEAFKVRFGEKVLSAPTFQGFNWLAWLTPFAVVLAAGATLAIAIRRRTAATPSGTPPPPSGDPTLRARLTRELDDLDRE
jgi:cytochrome c-type biogenesis protein CcmH/NrfF